MSHPVNRRDRFLKGVIKSKKRLPHFCYHFQKSERIAHIEKWLHYYRNVTVFCSAPGCCGNPRRYRNELTVQELRYGRGNLYPDE